MSNEEINILPIKKVEQNTTGDFIGCQHFYGGEGLNILIGDPYAKTTIEIGWEMFQNRISEFPIEGYIYRTNRKEDLYATAIKNLRKKINFISLNNEFQNGELNDEDFEKEIEQNPHKYVVNVENIKTTLDLEILEEIVTKVNENFTIDELAEVFSLDISGCNQQIQFIK